MVELKVYSVFVFHPLCYYLNLVLFTWMIAETTSFAHSNIYNEARMNFLKHTSDQLQCLAQCLEHGCPRMSAVSEQVNSTTLFKLLKGSCVF